MRTWAGAAFLGTVVALQAACAAPPPARVAVIPLATARTVSAIVLVNHCANLGASDARRAQLEMNQLTEGCAGFTGGSVRFTATLLPGGAIQFEPGPDASASIPLCVLSHPLKHTVHLRKSCSLDVQLEVSSMALPPTPVKGP
jgi:hypothetical protein